MLNPRSQFLVLGQWFPPGTPVSSTGETESPTVSDCCVCVKGWVWANTLRLITTSTCWGSKYLWSQLLSFLLNLWVPPLVAIGTCETQGLRETMTLLCGLLDGSVSVQPIPCPALCLWHAEREQCGQILQPSLPHKKSHILAIRTCSTANRAAPSDS